MEPIPLNYGTNSQYNLEEEHYIEDDFLSRNIDLCSAEGSNDDKFILHFCMFVINKECFIEGHNERTDEEPFLYFDKFFPFLQFYMKKIDGVYQFPQMEFKCAVPNESPIVSIEPDVMMGGEDEKPQSQIYFENECFRFLTTFFQDAGVIHSLPADFISTFYKGFKEFQETGDATNTKQIFVFYDITDHIQYFKKEESVLAIIDEIVFKKKINNDEVNPLYFQFFKENPRLLNMKMGETKIPYPFQLYMCKKEGEETLTVLQKGDLPKVIEHDVFGPSYIFTAEPFGENPVRFSCFIIKSVYYLQDITEEPIFSEEDTEDKIDNEKENQEQKQEQEQEQESSLEPTPVVEPQVAPVKGDEEIKNENSIKKEGGDITEEPSKNKVDFLYVPTVYYWENGVQYWCIRNNNHFTIL